MGLSSAVSAQYRGLMWCPHLFACALQVAIKFINRNTTVDYSLVAREVKSHSLLVHPHVIQFKRLGISPDKRWVYMVRWHREGLASTPRIMFAVRAYVRIMGRTTERQPGVCRHAVGVNAVHGRRRCYEAPTPAWSWEGVNGRAACALPHSLNCLPLQAGGLYIRRGSYGS